MNETLKIVQKGIELSNNNTIAECTADTSIRILFSKNIISAAKYNKVEWEITIKISRRICIAFGYLVIIKVLETLLI